MTISISNPIEATQIFIAILTLALLLSFRRRTKGEPFPISVTHELKGLSILAIIFAHVGYSLVSDNRFLFPISILAGVGVDLFLFLSGYGLVMSSMKKNPGIWEFYRARLLKLFTPLWLTLTAFLLLDYFVLHRQYPWGYITSAFAGFFSSANLYLDLNSPLWYFTFILFYYLVFPLFFSRKRPWLSALFIYAISYFVLQSQPLSISKVMGFYELHDMAFPLGMIAGGIFYNPRLYFDNKFTRRARSFISSFKSAPGEGNMPERNIFRINQWTLKTAKLLGHYLLQVVLIYVIVYTAVHAGFDESTLTRQLISIITMTALVLFFLTKKTEVRMLHWFGLYSYEIYLFHWPILSRYDIFFTLLPGWLAMAAYLFLFLILGRLLKKADKELLKNIIKRGLKATRLVS